MKTPDINALRRKQSSNSTNSSANTDTRTNTATTTNDSDEDPFFWFAALTYLYLVPSMIWTSFEHGFDYSIKDFFKTVFIPFKYIKLDEYWMAAGVVVGNIVASVILLMVLGMLSETIDNGVWDTDMEFDGKVIFFYIIIFAGFFIVPLTRPWKKRGQYPFSLYSLVFCGEIEEFNGLRVPTPLFLFTTCKNPMQNRLKKNQRDA